MGCSPKKKAGKTEVGRLNLNINLNPEKCIYKEETEIYEERSPSGI